MVDIESQYHSSPLKTLPQWLACITVCTVNHFSIYIYLFTHQLSKIIHYIFLGTNSTCILGHNVLLKNQYNSNIRVFRWLLHCVAAVVRNAENEHLIYSRMCFSTGAASMCVTELTSRYLGLSFGPIDLSRWHMESKRWKTQSSYRSVLMITRFELLLLITSTS